MFVFCVVKLVNFVVVCRYVWVDFYLYWFEVWEYFVGIFWVCESFRL